jgi:hypothetical protein
MVALRQRQARAIRNALLNLSGQEGRPDFAVCTFPVLNRIHGALSQLRDAADEGNTREIFRHLRNTLMNGGWNYYRDATARQAAADILAALAEADEVLPQQVEESFDRLYAAGLNPVGAPVFEISAEDDASHAEGEVPG